MADDVAAGLAQSIAALRAELATALEEGRNKHLQFVLNEVEIEFQVVVTRDASAEGGVRFGVVSFGAKGRLADEATHRIGLKMQPVSVSPEGRTVPAQISDAEVGEPD